jgi:hypothetical protein
MMQYAGAASDLAKAKQSIEDAKALTEKAKSPDEKVRKLHCPYSNCEIDNDQGIEHGLNLFGYYRSLLNDFFIRSSDLCVFVHTFVLLRSFFSISSTFLDRGHQGDGSGERRAEESPLGHVRKESLVQLDAVGRFGG